jgi:uncharacterized protein YqeY
VLSYKSNWLEKFMTLYEQIGENLKEAMKAGDSFVRDTLRLVQSVVKNVAIDKRVAPGELADEEVQEILKRLVKQRKDSITQYEAGGRADLAAGEQKELEVIAGYLPAEMNDEALQKIVQEALVTAGMSSKQDMGKAMGVAMQAVAGRASGDRVKALVAAFLQ